VVVGDDGVGIFARILVLIMAGGIVASIAISAL
jgi:hypothetical protein